jgi:hypothetical protein
MAKSADFERIKDSRGADAEFLRRSSSMAPAYGRVIASVKSGRAV